MKERANRRVLPWQITESMKKGSRLWQLRQAVESHGLSPIPMFGIYPDFPEPGVNICSCERPDCSAANAGKHPRIKWGEMTKPATWGDCFDWLRRLPSNPADPFNWAFRMDLSHKVVIDIDPRNGGDESWAALVAKFGSTSIPTTVRDAVLTRGFHLWFEAPALDNALPNPGAGRLELAPGVDLKYGKGYVVGPPSLHRCGEWYNWSAGLAPWETPFSPLPSCVIDLANEISSGKARESAAKHAAAMASGSSSPSPHVFAPKTSSTVRVIDRARLYVAKMPPAISGQGGSKVACHVASVLVNGFALDYSQAMVVMEEWNERCDPPWTRRELARKLEWAEEQPGPRGELLNDNGRLEEWKRNHPSAIDRELGDLLDRPMEFCIGDKVIFGWDGAMASTTRATVGQHDTHHDTIDRRPAIGTGPLSYLAAIVSCADSLASLPDKIDEARAAGKIDPSPIDPEGRYVNDTAAAASIRADRRDFSKYPCCNTKKILLEHNRSGDLAMIERRCEKRTRCDGCRNWLNDRDIGNCKCRIGACERIEKPLYEMNCAIGDDGKDSAWKALRRRLHAANANYFRVTDEASSFYWIVTTANLSPTQHQAGAEPIMPSVSVEKFRTLVLAHHGEKRPVTSSRGWKLPPYREKDQDFSRIGQCDQHLTTRTIVEIAEFCGASANPKNSKDPRIKRFWQFVRHNGLWDEVSRDHFKACMEVGETLPREFFEQGWDGWRTDPDDLTTTRERDYSTGSIAADFEFAMSG